MARIRTAMSRGLVAGAAGTTALNAVTYLDMAIRARPSSQTPEQAVERAAELLGVSVPGDEAARNAREAGLGPLLGTTAGLTAGLVLGVLRGLGWPRDRGSTLVVAWILAMLAGNAPMTVLGVTDPRTWSAKDWIADIAPHLAYAVASTATVEAFEE